MNDLKITCLGGGPASLYFSLLLRTAAKPPNPEEMLEVAIARGEVLSD